jgi:hypothetical protein
MTRLLGKMNHFNDLMSLDEDLYRGLLQLKEIASTTKNESKDSDGDKLMDLGLTFEVQTNYDGQWISKSLIPGGADISVDCNNYRDYIRELGMYCSVLYCIVLSCTVL